jgi:hypothetical protein
MTEKFTVNLIDLPTYYINLDKDIDKKNNVEQSLQNLGFSDVRRFAGFEESVKRVGVAKSHRAILENLLKIDTPFVVFEDDIQVASFVKQISVPTDADAFYLGNSIFGLYGGSGKKRISVERIDEETFRLYNMLAAHAIVYFNKEYIKFLIQAIDFNLSIETNQDKARAETMKYWKIYGAAQPLFYQPGRHEAFTNISLPNKFCVGPSGAFEYK